MVSSCFIKSFTLFFLQTSFAQTCIRPFCSPWFTGTLFLIKFSVFFFFCKIIWEDQKSDESLYDNTTTLLPPPTGSGLKSTTPAQEYWLWAYAACNWVYKVIMKSFIAYKRKDLTRVAIFQAFYFFIRGSILKLVWGYFSSLICIKPNLF